MIRPVRLLASDIDGTLLGNEAAAGRFRRTWHALGQRERPLLVYNSSRPVDDILSLIDAKLLPAPNHVIGALGTVIAGGLVRARLQAFVEGLGPPLNADAITAVMETIEGATLQAAVDQHPHKASWCLPDATAEHISEIAARLSDAGLDVKLIYSSRRNLDILPHAGGKASALAWMCRELAVNLCEVVVAGDTRNDLEMFEMPHVRGIVVANALPELRDAVTTNGPHLLASGCHADGVIEGLRRWGVLQ